MWPENLSLAGRGLCLRAAGKHVPAGRIRCQSAADGDRAPCLRCNRVSGKEGNERERAEAHRPGAQEIHQADR